MIDWRTIKLEKVITDIAAGPFGSNLKVECFVESGFPIIDGANLKGFKVTDNITKFVTEEKARSLHRSIAKRNDVIVTISGNVGQIAYIPNDSKYIEYLVSQRQFRVSFDESAIDVPYLVYYFHTREGQHKILSFANQVGVPALAQPLKNFKAIELNLPSLPTQHRIASILSSLDDKIDLLHRENKTLEAMAETLFRQWFIEEAKEDWEEKSLGKCLKLVGGGTPKTSEERFWNGKVCWLSGGDITNNHKSFVSCSEKSISEDGLNNSSAKLLPENAMVVSARGTVGKYCLLSKPMAFSQSNYGILPIYTDCYFFTYLLVAYHIEELQSAAYGSVFDTITTKTFEGVNVLLPQEPDYIVEFEKMIEPCFSKMKQNNNQIQTLTQQRDGLLPKLMSGEVKI